MGYDAIGGCALGGVDGAHPSGPGVPIGEPGEVEGILLAVLVLDRDASLRIDPHDAGGMPVQSPRAPVVAGELYPVPGAKLLLHFDELT